MMRHVKAATAKFTLTPLYTFLIALVIQGLGALCLHFWLKSEWMAGYPTKGWEEWEGYTLAEFWALFFFVVFSTIGFSMMFTTFQHFNRKLASSPSSALHYLLLAVIFLYLGGLFALGVYWTRHLAPCAFLWCQNTTAHTWVLQPDDPLPTAAYGWRASIGFPMLITSAALVVSLIVAKVQHGRNARYHRSHGSFFKKTQSSAGLNGEPLLNNQDDVDTVHSMPQNRLLKRYTPYNTHLLSTSKTQTLLADSKDMSKKALKQHIKAWLVFAVFAAFMLFWFVTAAYIPNTWQALHPSSLAASAQKTVPSPYDGALCRTEAGKNMCPENDQAVFHTTVIRLTDYWYLKFFPSNTIFYLFIILMAFAFVTVQHTHPKLKAFFAYKIRVPRPWNSVKRDRVAFFTVGELATIISTSLALFLFGRYWIVDHNFLQKWPYASPESKLPTSSVIARSLGQIAVFIFSLLMFPAARNSPILAMIGVSWEASIQYHRWLGVLFFVATMGHMVSSYVWYANHGSLKTIFQIPAHFPNGIDNFTVPLIQVFVWLMIISIGVFAIAWRNFRREHFNIFMMLHHFTYLTLIPAILWHAQASWEYILPALTIWFVDRAMRAYRSIRCVNLITSSQYLASQATYSPAAASGPNAANMFNPLSIQRRFITPPPLQTIHQHGFQTAPKQVEQSDIDSLGTSDASFAFGSDGISNVRPTFHQTAHQDLNLHPSQRGAVMNVSGPGIRIVDRGEAGTYIELRIVNDNMVYFPGHYAFLNVAEISLFEWHPFTIASPVHFCSRSEVVFVIKTMGKNTWTQSLYSYIRDHYDKLGIDPFTTSNFVDIPLTISVDGPYGTPIDFGTYDVVVLLGGGIGVTPCKSIYESLLLSYLHDYKARLEFHTQDQLIDGNKRIHLMWSARDPTLFELMSESLEAVPFGPFSAQLFCDNPYLKDLQDRNLLALGESQNMYKPDANVDEELINKNKPTMPPHLVNIIRPGRPDLETEIGHLVTESGKDDLVLGHVEGRRVLVFVCGPGPMAQDAEEICQRRGWDFHTETFAL